MRILIVEDDPSSANILKIMLSPHGECKIAVDGKDGLNTFINAWDEGKPFDLICLDIMMPEMNGMEALKAIREFEEERGLRGLSGVKISMVTALGDFKHVKIAFRDQCENYIVKPITRAKIDKMVSELFPASESK